VIGVRKRDISDGVTVRASATALEYCACKLTGDGAGGADVSLPQAASRQVSEYTDTIFSRLRIPIRIPFST
jgi:hypothetical protein